MSSLIEFEDGTSTQVIKQYLRDKNNQKIGLLVCLWNEDQDSAVIGWSRCGLRDTFNVQQAHDIAVGRALLGDSGRNVPYAILFDVFDFMGRCRRYFKGADVFVAGQLPLTEEEFKDSDMYLKGVKKSRKAFENKHRPITSA